MIQNALFSVQHSRVGSCIIAALYCKLGGGLDAAGQSYYTCSELTSSPQAPRLPCFICRFTE